MLKLPMNGEPRIRVAVMASFYEGSLAQMANHVIKMPTLFRLLLCFLVSSSNVHGGYHSSEEYVLRYTVGAEES